MHRFLLGKVMFILALCSCLIRLESANAESATLSFDPWLDGGLAISGASVALSSQFWLNPSSLDLPATPDVNQIPAYDNWLTAPYNDGLAGVSDITQYLAAFSPMLYPLLSGQDDWLAAASINFEVLSFTFAAKNVGKAAFPRLRPWTYDSGGTIPQSVQDEAWQSWPSGHTALAFAGASSLLTMALASGNDNPATPWVVGSSLGLACLTAGLRIASGEHFLSDVLSGALIGSIFGVADTLMHIKPKN